MKLMPLVSIVIPVYNGANYLQQAIDSALSQSYPNCEVIVINDGSIDEGKTDSIAQQYTDKIRYYSKENGGVSSALNLGIQVMKGEYFSWLSHDDVYLPHKIENQVIQLKKIGEPDAISFCGFKLVDQSLAPLKRNASAGLPSDTLISGEETLNYMFKRGTLSGCALLIPKAAFERCGSFDEKLRFNQDSFMWYKMFLAGYTLCYAPEVGVYQRTHHEQATQREQSTFSKDCIYMNDYMMNALKKRSDLFYSYILYNAKHNIVDVVSACLHTGREQGLLNKNKRFVVYLYMMYGRIRPLLKHLYYSIIFKLSSYDREG